MYSAFDGSLQPECIPFSAGRNAPLQHLPDRRLKCSSRAYRQYNRRPAKELPISSCSSSFHHNKTTFLTIGLQHLHGTHLNRNMLRFWNYLEKLVSGLLLVRYESIDGNLRIGVVSYGKCVCPAERYFNRFSSTAICCAEMIKSSSGCNQSKIHICLCRRI